MIDPRHEEQAALSALGWLDDPAGLERAAARDPEVARTMQEFSNLAALLAYDTPQVLPPPQLREQILAALGPASAPALAPARTRSAAPHREPSRLLRFPRIALLPYALAACLMGIALFQAALILLLDHRLDASRVPASHRDPFAGVQMVDLAPQGDHGAAKCMVAWNGKTSTGMLAMSDMPAPPAGSDYQLWVLDPSKPAPVSAGVIPHGVRSQHFVAGEVKMPGRPGFAISMEPAGGRSEPTPGQILFAVAPSP
jgi:anti-sigma-K factor RskA